jgi:hypothetical protein
MTLTETMYTAPNPQQTFCDRKKRRRRSRRRRRTKRRHKRRRRSRRRRRTRRRRRRLKKTQRGGACEFYSVGCWGPNTAKGDKWCRQWSNTDCPRCVTDLGGKKKREKREPPAHTKPGWVKQYTWPKSGVCSDVNADVTLTERKRKAAIRLEEEIAANLEALQHELAAH